MNGNGMTMPPPTTQPYYPQGPPPPPPAQNGYYDMGLDVGAEGLLDDDEMYGGDSGPPPQPQVELPYYPPNGSTLPPPMAGVGASGSAAYVAYGSSDASLSLGAGVEAVPPPIVATEVPAYVGPAVYDPYTSELASKGSIDAYGYVVTGEGYIDPLAADFKIKQKQNADLGAPAFRAGLAPPAPPMSASMADGHASCEKQYTECELDQLDEQKPPGVHVLVPRECQDPRYWLGSEKRFQKCFRAIGFGGDTKFASRASLRQALEQSGVAAVPLVPTSPAPTPSPPAPPAAAVVVVSPPAAAGTDVPAAVVVPVASVPAATAAAVAAIKKNGGLPKKNGILRNGRVVGKNGYKPWRGGANGNGRGGRNSNGSARANGNGNGAAKSAAQSCAGTSEKDWCDNQGLFDLCARPYLPPEVTRDVYCAGLAANSS